MVVWLGTETLGGEVGIREQRSIMPDVVSSELSTGPGTLVEWKCSQILPVQAQSAGVTQGADRDL